jgi:hypothetical protein
MKIGGWRTREVFERYNIIDQEDLEDAARRLDEKRDRQLLEKAASDVTKQATSALKSATESQSADERPVVQLSETVRIQ